MSSPKIIVFYLYNESTGAVLTGATPTFDTYKDDLGTNITQPSITEIGGGAYKFTPDITSTPNRGIAFVINGGAGSIPRRQNGYVRPEDFALDTTGADVTALSSTISTINSKIGTPVSSVSLDIAAIQTKLGVPLTTVSGDIGSVITTVNNIETKVFRIQLFREARSKIFTSGPDNNRQVDYAADGTTVIQKWNLFDSLGAPTTTNIFERVPVLSIP